MTIILPGTQNIIKDTTQSITSSIDVGEAPPESSGSFLSEAWAGIDGHFEATSSDSYDGTGTTWTDIIGGITATLQGNPTFTGTAGTSGARFVLDGSGDYASMDSLPTELSKVQRTDTGQGFTFIEVVKLPSSGVTRGFANANGTSDVGFRTASNVAADNMAFDYFDGVQYLGHAADVTVTGSSSLAGSYMTRIITLSADRRTVTVYANSTTGISNTRGALTITADATASYNIHANSAGSAVSPNGTEMITFAWGQGLPTSQEISNLFSALNTAHGRTYV